MAEPIEMLFGLWAQGTMYLDGDPDHSTQSGN